MDDLERGYQEGTKFLVQETGKKYLLLGYIKNTIQVELDDLKELCEDVRKGIAVSKRVIDFIVSENYFFSQHIRNNAMIFCLYKENMYEQTLYSNKVISYRGLAYNTKGILEICGTPSPLFNDWLMKNKLIDTSLRELITYDEMLSMYEEFHNEYYDDMRDCLYDMMLDKSGGVNGLYLYENDILYRDDGEYFYITKKPKDKVDFIDFVQYFNCFYVSVNKENKVDVSDKNGLLWRINQFEGKSW